MERWETHREIASMSWVRSGHHVLSIKHLDSKLRNSDSPVLLASTCSKRCKAGHEEVKTRERNHVDGQLAQVRVQLTREAQASGDARHDGRDQVVQVTVRGVGQLQGAHADVVEGLVVDAEGLVGVLDELVDGERGVVGLNNGIRDLARKLVPASCQTMTGVKAYLGRRDD